MNKMLGIDFGEEEIGVEMSDAERVETFDVVEVVDGVEKNGKVGVFPGIDDGLINPVPDYGNDFDAGFFGKGKDVFWGPCVADDIESVEDGFPGVDFHNPIKHFGMVNLDDKTVKEGFVDGFSEFDYFVKL